MRTLRSPGGLLALLLAGIVSLPAADAGAASSPPPAAVVPGAEWTRAEDVARHGLNAARLAALTPFLQSLDTTAMMVVVDGRVVFDYGDLARVSYLASGRKSILSLLYGNAVASGAVRLNQTLAELGFDDLQGLTPAEREATVEDLLTSRSGIYHPASNGGDATASAPPRGSQRPGQYYLYNNWDFNAAGTLYEQATGREIYAALEEDLVIPLGMQDYDPARQKKSGNAERSRHLAYPIELSTRDMARIGQLVLRKGEWAGRQLVPRDWIERTTAVVTPPEVIQPASWRGMAEGGLWGYGILWWVWADRGLNGPFRGAHTAWGVSGQYITILPELRMVVAHKTVPGRTPEGRTRGVSVMQYQAILMHLVAAHERGAVETRR